MNDMVKVQRFAGLQGMDNQWTITQVNLNLDVGNNLIPLWPVNLQLDGRTFRFLMDGPSGRTLYRDSEHPDWNGEFEKEDKISYEALESFAQSQHEQLNEYAKVIKAQQLFIDKLNKDT